MLLLLIGTVCFSQTEPEFTGEATDFSGHFSLEKKAYDMSTKANASAVIIGAGKVNTKAVVDGAFSTVGYAQGDTIKFVINVGSTDRNPTDFISIQKMEVNTKKNKRSVLLSSIGTLSGDFKTTPEEALPYRYKKFSGKSFLITVPPGLVPGEYAVVINGFQHLLLFAVK